MVQLSRLWTYRNAKRRQIGDPRSGFFKVPYKKSRLDAGAAAALARRHPRTNPRSDGDARQIESRVDVGLPRVSFCCVLSECVPDSSLERGESWWPLRMYSRSRRHKLLNTPMRIEVVQQSCSYVAAEIG
jgi:hypothetical protein